MSADKKARVLFLCTGNACRSQMAEGWARHFHGDKLEVCSAGIMATRLDPRAAAVMAEQGVNIYEHRSKTVAEFAGQRFDLMVAVCDSAARACPSFPGAAKTLRRGFDDPPSLAMDARSDEEALQIYRRVRDEIRDFVEKELMRLVGEG